LTRPSAHVPLSTPWEAPVAGYGGRVVACRRLDARLPADGALWKRVWVGRVLGRREREQFGALRTPEHRQLEWLGARTAAKEALAELLRARHGLDLLPADIEILPDDRGRPRVEVAGVDECPLVSLAHSQGETVAFAALAGRGRRIGIDIEHLRAEPEGFAEAALSPEERRGLPDGDEWVLRSWCAKEAAGKAAGCGMSPAPVIAAVDVEQEDIVLEADGRRLHARTRLEAGLIVATVLDEEDGP
jgi:phosphopantetheinyl transferase (holo-ACP synthase)